MRNFLHKIVRESILAPERWGAAKWGARAVTGYEGGQADWRRGDVFYDRLGTLLPTSLSFPVLVWPLSVGRLETTEETLSMLGKRRCNKQASAENWERIVSLMIHLGSQTVSRTCCGRAASRQLPR